MKDAPFDLRDYVLDELTPAERAEVERFLSTSVEAREEVERLRLTHRALLTLPQEEPQRRIAFVSDKVFEPSRARRIWHELWQGAPRFGFSMAALLLVFFAGAWATQPTMTRDPNGWRVAFGPAPSVQTAAVQPAAAATHELNSQQMRQVLALVRENDARLDAAIAQAVKVSENKSQDEIRSEIRQIRAAWDDYAQFDKARWDRLMQDLNTTRQVAFDGR